MLLISFNWNLARVVGIEEAKSISKKIENKNFFYFCVKKGTLNRLNCTRNKCQTQLNQIVLKINFKLAIRKWLEKVKKEIRT